MFQRSDAAIAGEWVVAGLDSDVELLQLVASDAFGFTRFGQYLRRLREQFAPAVVMDMFCLLRLQLELSVQGQGHAGGAGGGARLTGRCRFAVGAG